MNTELTPDERNALVKYRFERSRETLVEADYNAEGGYFNTAVNRLYYSAYYAAAALMLAAGLNSSTHAGIRTLLSLHFVKTGKLDACHARTFMTLYENRQSGDYEDFVYCDQDLYDQLRPRTVAFIDALQLLTASL